jgi:hypothetical protein
MPSLSPETIPKSRLIPLILRSESQAARRLGAARLVLMFRESFFGEFGVPEPLLRMRIDLDRDFAGRASIAFPPERTVAYAASYAIRHKRITPRF